MADADDPEDRAELKAKLDQLRREKRGYEARIDSLEEKLAGYDLLDQRMGQLVRDVDAIRERLSDPDKLTWPERREIIDHLHLSFRGDGLTLYLEHDPGLRDISPEVGPLVVCDTAMKSNTRMRRWSS
jgi:hypothetical protein